MSEYERRIDRRWGWLPGTLAAAILILLAIWSTGCAPGVRDLTTLLNNPAVQATIQQWRFTADATNPSIDFELYSGGRLKLSGVIVRGDLSGAGKAGIDPALYAALVKIAQESGYYVPTTQPATTTPEVSAQLKRQNSQIGEMQDELSELRNPTSKPAGATP